MSQMSTSSVEQEIYDILTEEEEDDESFEEETPSENGAQRKPRLKRKNTITPSDYKYKVDCALPEYTPRFVNVPTVIVLVGLPARGKTYMAKKLGRYLNWIGIQCKVFNVGEYRRKAVGMDKLHDFFKVDNQEAQAIRRQCAIDCLNDVSSWLDEGVQAAIFDATNTTRERRRMVLDYCRRRGYKTFFMESVCNNSEIVASNIKEVKVFSPDYKEVDKEQAFNDFKERIKHYQAAYEPLTMEDGDLSFIKIINAGEQYLVNNIDGYLQSKSVYFLMNLHVRKRSIYLVRHAECENNVHQLLGGDTDLTKRGDEFAQTLAAFINEQDIPDLKVWTSQLKRAVQTAKYIQHAPVEPWKALNEIDYGIYDGRPVSDLNTMGPDDIKARHKNMFIYRYPLGESYSDVCARLEPVIMELERQNNVVLIVHEAVMQIIMAYFTNHTPDEIPNLDIPLHTVFKLTPIAYGCRVERFPLEAPVSPASPEK
ncbi:predicted protein [Nematostella vectensis]|uniref:6-phosphofructo-2-kinase domain-containing protein n=1 Tax=Nematostella vectensis TaxID=45351 RepID=A7SNT5_NEMVE|nr:predicted protein [Nematostella vectensis]|eukprot:XP_001626719.1 predicted protein [Nematostella vectensis]